MTRAGSARRALSVIGALVLAGCDAKADQPPDLAAEAAGFPVPDQCVTERLSPPGNAGLRSMLRRYPDGDWPEKDPTWGRIPNAVVQCAVTRGWNPRQRKAALAMVVARAVIANAFADLGRSGAEEVELLRATATLSDADLAQAAQAGRVNDGLAHQLEALDAAGVDISVPRGAAFERYITALTQAAHYVAEGRRFAGRTVERPTS